MKVITGYRNGHAGPKSASEKLGFTARRFGNIVSGGCADQDRKSFRLGKTENKAGHKNASLPKYLLGSEHISRTSITDYQPVWRILSRMSSL